MWIDLWDGCISSHAFTKLDDFFAGEKRRQGFHQLGDLSLAPSVEREAEDGSLVMFMGRKTLSMINNRWY